MEIMPSPGWPVGKPVIHFLDMEVSDKLWVVLPLGWYCPWVGSPGC